MYSALTLFNEMDQEDIDWVMNQGTEEQIISGKILLTEGVASQHIYLVLEGLLGITIAALGGHKIAEVGVGDLVGEYSFISGDLPSATVAAVENSLVLAISTQQLETRLKEHPSFAARFYRALALMGARRVKSGAGVYKHMFEEGQTHQATRIDLWDNISEHVAQFKAKLQEAERASLKNQDCIPHALAEEIRAGFRAFCVMVNETIGHEVELNEHVRTEIGLRLQRELLPYMLLARISERIYAKPRGYAGDFLTIEMIYQDQAEGGGRIGPLLDRCFLDEPPARAVKNRRGLLSEEIQAVMDAAGEETVNVTSMASGPAAEIFDVFGKLENPNRLKATLIDIDLQALAFVSDKADNLRLRRQIKPVNGNLVYLATGRQKLDLPPQDLVYSIGLIDYFNDKFVIALLNYVYDILKPGGKVILGNFHPRNSGRAMMDYVLEWQLIHRTEEDMHRLYRASKFASNCSRIRFEAEGINLFAECIKA